jgi:hypothetical protein
MQAVGGATCYAETALGALLIIDGSEVIHNGDCTFGTSLFTLLTADTCNRAILACDSTLLVVAALNKGLLALEYQMDDALRTGAYTHATADTSGGVDLCNTVDNRDSLYRADSGAVATAKTAVGTSVLATVEHGCRVASLDAVIYHLIGVGIIVAATSNDCDEVAGLLDNFDAEHLANLSGGVGGARDTEVGSGLTLCESLCVLITASIAAGATVDAREASTEASDGLVYFYVHKVRGYSEQ